MSLRFPSATSASSVPDGDKILRLYPWSGRTCAPPMNSLYVRSIGGSPGERGARSAERGTGRARLFRVPTSAFGVSAFKYSHIPSFPPSRPNPDSRYPPNPEAASKDRKSTRLNSSHLVISYAVFCLKKKKNKLYNRPQSHAY